MRYKPNLLFICASIALLTMTSLCFADVVQRTMDEKKVALQAVITKADEDISAYQTAITHLQALKEKTLSETGEFDKVETVTVTLKKVLIEEPIIDEELYGNMGILEGGSSGINW